MHFRVTDEREFQRGFDAESPAALAVGIRAACESYAAHGGGGVLRLHVWGRTSAPNGIWLTPTSNPTAPRVTTQQITYSDATNRAIVVATDECAPVFDWAARMIEHHERLYGLGDQVAAAVETAQGPGPGRAN